MQEWHTLRNLYGIYISKERQTLSNLYARIAICSVRKRRPQMFDAIMIGTGFGFFIAAIIYTITCDRL